MESDRKEQYMIILDDSLQTIVYPTASKALKRALELAWTAERQVQIVKVVKTIDVQKACI